jgi:hypothetical protein
VIERHLLICDHCVGLVGVAHARLAIAAEIPYAVPPQLQQRVMQGLAPQPALVTEPAERGRIPTPAARGWLAAVRDQLMALTRLPVLVPAGFTVGVLLMLAGNRSVWNAVPAGPLTRAVPIERTLRVTAPEAIVRSQPHARADAVATLSRGQVIQVDREDREWYRFALPGGAEGWVDRGAFE